MNRGSAVQSSWTTARNYLHWTGRRPLASIVAPSSACISFVRRNPFLTQPLASCSEAGRPSCLSRREGSDMSLHHRIPPRRGWQAGRQAGTPNVGELVLGCIETISYRQIFFLSSFRDLSCFANDRHVVQSSANLYSLWLLSKCECFFFSNSSFFVPILLVLGRILYGNCQKLINDIKWYWYTGVSKSINILRILRKFQFVKLLEISLKMIDFHGRRPSK